MSGFWLKLDSINRFRLFGFAFFSPVVEALSSVMEGDTFDVFSPLSYQRIAEVGRSLRERATTLFSPKTPSEQIDVRFASHCQKSSLTRAIG
jgi:hypothetical protein